MSDIEIHGATNAPREDQDAGAQLPFPGVFAELGALPPSTFINDEGLARLIGKSTFTIHRMVANGQLPIGAKFGANITWTVGKIVAHHEKRMEQAERDALAMRAKLKAV